MEPWAGSEDAGRGCFAQRRNYHGTRSGERGVEESQDSDAMEAEYKVEERGGSGDVG